MQPQGLGGHWFGLLNREIPAHTQQQQGLGIPYKFDQYRLLAKGMRCGLRLVPPAFAIKTQNAAWVLAQMLPQAPYGQTCAAKHQCHTPSLSGWIEQGLGTPPQAHTYQQEQQHTRGPAQGLGLARGVGNGLGCFQTKRLKTKVPLVPPKPKLFFMATSIFRSRAVLAQ